MLLTFFSQEKDSSNLTEIQFQKRPLSNVSNFLNLYWNQHLQSKFRSIDAFIETTKNNISYFLYLSPPLIFLISSVFTFVFTLAHFLSLSLSLMLTCRWRVRCDSDLHLPICDSSPSHETPALRSDSPWLITHPYDSCLRNISQ